MYSLIHTFERRNFCIKISLDYDKHEHSFEIYKREGWPDCPDDFEVRNMLFDRFKNFIQLELVLHTQTDFRDCFFRFYNEKANAWQNTYEIDDLLYRFYRISNVIMNERELFFMRRSNNILTNNFKLFRSVNQLRYERSFIFKKLPFVYSEKWKYRFVSLPNFFY